MSRHKTYPDVMGRACGYAAAAIILALSAVAYCADTEMPKLAKPILSTEKVPHETYGDAVSVRMFARLLKDDDPRMRERAVQALGQSHNAEAVDIIAQAAGDKDPDVRAAAVTAAGQFTGRKPAEIVTRCLGDENRLVLFEALKIAARMSLTQAGGQIRNLCRHEDHTVQAVALETLTALGIAADSDLLESLMKSPSPVVRLRAVQNSFLSSDGAALLDSLKLMAGPNGNPAVRGEAIAAIGKFGFAMAGRIVADAGGQADPLIRRGAVWAYHNAGQSLQLNSFLSDRSPLVVLAAVRATGNLKITSSVERLLEILIEAPDTELHEAARDALQKMGAQAIVKPVGDSLEAIAGRLSTPPAAQGRPEAEKISTRNIRSLCRLLGAFDSHEKFSLRLNLFRTLKIDDDIQLDLVPSLAATASDEAAEAMTARMPFCNEQGKKALWANTVMIRPYVEYRQDVHATIIDALARLKATGAVDVIIGAVNARYQTDTLSLPTTAAARALAVLATPAKREHIEKTVVMVLKDRNYSQTARFAMSMTAGKLKLSSAVPALAAMLNEERFSRMTMLGSAWAIQEITGKTPAIGEPRLNQSDDWVIRQNVK